MAGKKNNATSSWSGYNHQGQVGIFLALKELGELLQKDEVYSDYSVQFEKEDGEDVDIVANNIVISRHQVKAKTTSKNLNSYNDVLTGFNTDGVKENSRYLHTICEVIGFDLPEEEFKKLPNKPKFIPNKCKIKLYEYPDGYKYCELSNQSESKIDNFCKMEIKSILIKHNHNLKNDDDHINETLFVLKDLLCTKIREAHETGRGANPVILFPEIYDILTSTEKRQRQSIREARNLFARYWNKNFQRYCNEAVIDNSLVNDILNLSDEEFQNFLIDLHPQKDIKEALDNQTIFELLDEDIFEEIFYEFYKEINQKFFDLYELRYNSRKSSYRLSLINKKYKKGEVGNLIQTIRNNRGFLKASFEVDYLVNGRINSPLFEYDLQNVDIISPYGQQPSMQDNLFSNYLEFIDIDNTVEKLRGEKNE